MELEISTGTAPRAGGNGGGVAGAIQRLAQRVPEREAWSLCGTDTEQGMTRGESCETGSLSLSSQEHKHHAPATQPDSPSSAARHQPRDRAPHCRERVQRLGATPRGSASLGH